MTDNNAEVYGAVEQMLWEATNGIAKEKLIRAVTLDRTVSGADYQKNFYEMPQGNEEVPSQHVRFSLGPISSRDIIGDIEHIDVRIPLIVVQGAPKAAYDRRPIDSDGEDLLVDIPSNDIFLDVVKRPTGELSRHLVTLEGLRTFNDRNDVIGVPFQETDKTGQLYDIVRNLDTWTADQRALSEGISHETILQALNAYEIHPLETFRPKAEAA